MSDSPIPPVLAEVETQSTRPKWRWGVHLFILAAYVLAQGIAGAFLKPEGAGSVEPAMPATVGALARMCAIEMALFLFIFGIACAFSRATPRDLLLKWRGGFRPILWGVAYSVALRFVIMIFVILIAAPIVYFKGEKAVEGLRPKTESLVNAEALKDPVYVLFAVTVVSFGVAGFREELWRVGIMAGFAGLAPAIFTTRRGQLIAVVVAAVIFGIGHAPQGIGGVVITAALGLALGCIIVRHQSIWEAVMAHGFFDATTFVGLYIFVKYFPEVLRGLGASG
jgi:membrane protease YdiL (CAAX protease family)